MIVPAEFRRLLAGAYGDVRARLEWTDDGRLTWEGHGTMSRAQTDRWIAMWWRFVEHKGELRYRSECVCSARRAHDGERYWLRAYTPDGWPPIPPPVLALLEAQLTHRHSREWAEDTLRWVARAEADPQCQELDRRSRGRACARWDERDEALAVLGTTLTERQGAL